ncbi:hypothetical protein EH220_02150 [bacterium]|nr:MAG: hypothetical protein EH220_02150 [bacterium]
MRKTSIPTLAAKNRIISNIMEALDERKDFLMLGHKNPDEDCIASMVSFALLVTKFEKNATICFNGELHEHFTYLLNICRHNSIKIIGDGSNADAAYDTVVVCDTPKPDMIECGVSGHQIPDNPDLLRIEIDHHLEADSAYFGDEGYRLVDEASSACELVGLIALKLRHRKDLTGKYNITDLLSRNFVLAVITGIIGDSKMGKYLKTAREQRFYSIFSSMFNELLTGQTTRAGNFSNQDEVFNELGRLSDNEARCHSAFLDRRRTSDHIGYVIMDREATEGLYREFNHETIVAASRSIADILAEESGFLSLVVFYDDPTVSDLIQFRMRRSESFKRYDLRKIIKLLSIENGGGHEGAVGFRVPSAEITDIEAYTARLIEKTETEISPLINKKAVNRVINRR